MVTARAVRQPLSLEELVATVLQMIRRSGVESVNMRALAQELALSPMAPYRYVENKQALLEMAADEVYAGVAVPSPEGPWDARLRALVLSVLDVVEANPWVTEVLFNAERTRGAMTPNTRRVMAAVISILGDAGFDEDRVILGSITVAETVTGAIFQEQLRPRVHPHLSDMPSTATRGFTIDTLIAGLAHSLKVSTAPVTLETGDCDGT